MAATPVSLFFAYARKDQDLMLELESHLVPLKLGGLIRSWHDGCIEPGQEWEAQICNNLETAHIILLLISADSLKSEFCYQVEMHKAIERHNAGTAWVVPVILRPCLWQNVPLGNRRLKDLQALPLDAKPITTWSDKDAAFMSIAEAIDAKIQQWKQMEAEEEQRKQGEAEFRLRALHLITETQRRSYQARLAEDDISSAKGVEYAKLRDMLSIRDWRAADQETWYCMLEAVGRQPGDYIRDQELLNFPCVDLRTIDRLWVKYSQGKFGFSVQKQIYVECGAKLDGTYPGDKVWHDFCRRLGWRKGESGMNYHALLASLDKSPTGEFPSWGGGVYRWVLWVFIFFRIETCKL